MFSMQSFSAFCTATPGTPACIGIVALALMASIVSDFSGTSFLDEGQEEFIVLAILIPMSFMYAYWRKPAKAKVVKRVDDDDSPRIEKPGRKGVFPSQPSSEENVSRSDGHFALPERLETCAKAGDVSGAEQIMEEALDSGLESGRLAVCLGHLLQACVLAKDAKIAKASFERVKAAGVKANVVHYGTLISVHAQTGDITGAEKWFETCIESGIEPNNVCYNTMLYACSRAGNMTKLKEWFGRMEDLKVAKDHITFSTAIHAAIRAQDAASLETWLQQMSASGFVLQSRTYEDGLSMCAQASFSKVAELLFQEMVKNGVVTGKGVHHIARSRLYAGECNTCLEVLESRLKDGLDLVPPSYVTAAEACNKMNDSLACSRWLSRAEIQLAHSTDNISVIASIAVCVGKLDSAVSWMQKLQESGSAEQISTGFVTVLKCCARLSDDDSACTFADMATKSSISLTADGYSAAIKACCRASNIKAAESWLNKMIQANLVEDLSAFCNVIGLCARLEDASRGEFWLNSMGRLGPQSDACLKSFLEMCDKCTYRAAKMSASRVVAKIDPKRILFTSGENSLFLLKALIRLGHHDKAESVFQALDSKFGKNFAAQCQNCFINAYAQQGNIMQAEAWLARMTKAGRPADVISYSTIIHACAKAGDPLRAEGVLVRMQEAGVEPNTICFNEVINAFAENGDLKKAEQYFEAIKQRNLTPSTSTYNSILKACAKSGDATQAEAWYHKMVSQASGLQDVALDATTFGTLMNAWKDTDPMKTEQWLQTARSHGLKPNVVHYSTAIHAHAKKGGLEHAEALIEQAVADGVELNAMCFNNVISACGEAFAPERAEDWLVKMRESGVAPNSFTCFSVVNAWLKVNHFARAKNAVITMEKEGLQPREEVFTAFAKGVAKQGRQEDLEDCVKMAAERDCQNNEYFLHAHLSALVRFRVAPAEVEKVVRTAVSKGVKLNSYIRVVLNKAFPFQKVEALIQELGGIAEYSSSTRPSRKAYHSRNRD
eukprot:gnl/MRDRNA2_/MRDRNA2_84505_c0_seq2.p1 gnl/MRDRNA2_/MRDRNA2_84505_c0~~gnl/MRDRNA2_/MRDRNA2_84505_c0_seq2.p1  ORF type:complete len:1006 (+),score=220.05 gnl/MRDRNA2_/MRDRNA2_84505_c0_seq2:134-3151(+)